MSVVTFYGNDKVETAQTTSMAGIATYLSMEQNYRVLLINAKYNDASLEECFWSQSGYAKPRSDLETGIGGLIKAIASNKTSPEIITNYTKTIFKDRLEVLTDNNIPRENYEKQKVYMKSIIRMASKYYDLVFVDIEGSLEDPHIQEILKESNLIVANTSQRINAIREFFSDRRKYEVVSKDNIVILLGKYDKYSKYNAKNLQRTEKMQYIYGIPYNTLFFEACEEGKVPDLFLRFRKTGEDDRNGFFLAEVRRTSENIIYRLQDLQMRM